MHAPESIVDLRSATLSADRRAVISVEPSATPMNVVRWAGTNTPFSMFMEKPNDVRCECPGVSAERELPE